MKVNAESPNIGLEKETDNIAFVCREEIKGIMDTWTYKIENIGDKSNNNTTLSDNTGVQEDKLAVNRIEK